MATHSRPCGCSITYGWRFGRRPTPRALDLHPIVNRWKGPRALVWLGYVLWRHLTRVQRLSDCPTHS